VGSAFITEIEEEVRKNLAHTIDALGVGDVDWGATAVHVAGEILVKLIMLAVFVGIYVVLAGAMKFALKRWIPPATMRHLKIGLRYLVGLGLLLAVMAQWDASPEILRGTARAGLIAFGFLAAWIGLARLLQRAYERQRIDASIAQLLRNTFSIVFAIFAFVAVLAEFGFDVVSIVAGLGIVGIAVGFAAQSTLSNFIAGITLLIEQPFRIGDWVRINEQEGKVTKIALRTTWLRTRDNVFTMIPNHNVASSEVVNFSARGPIRIRIPVGIAYKESAKAAREVILPVLENHPQVIQTADMAPAVVVTGLGSSSVDLVALVWITQANIDVHPTIAAQLLEQMKEALDGAGIEIPFPHLQVFIDDAKGLGPVLEPLYPRLATSNEPKRKDA
jgi:small conductance mechanosensitive channel